MADGRAVLYQLLPTAYIILNSCSQAFTDTNSASTLSFNVPGTYGMLSGTNVIPYNQYVW
jgi:hypothetical protein